MSTAVIFKGANVDTKKGLMSREYNNGYYAYHGPPPYVYQGPDMYQGNPNMRQGQYMDWQGYQAHQYYPGFNPQEYQTYGYGSYGNYNQGYQMMPDQENYYNSQDGTQSGQNRTQINRSKHSYSQNRNKNRQRPDQLMQNDLNPAVISVNDNTNNNAVGGSSDFANQTGNNLKAVSERNDSNTSGNDTNDRGRNRGGRFQGHDTRSRPFDKAQQFNDRQRKYSKQAPLNEPAKVTNQEEPQVVSREGKTGKSTAESTGARAKSYRDNRGSATSRYRNDKEDQRDTKSRGYKSQPESNRNSYQMAKNVNHNENIDQGQKSDVDAEESKSYDPSNENIDGVESMKDRMGGARRKKKEIRVFSSSSHRDWPTKSVSSSQQEASNRYNYRGQDYNKRHKEIISLGMERGGDRTKLSNFEESSKDIDIEKTDNDAGAQGNGDSGGTAAKKSNRYGGANSVSRYKPKGKVDESQRGVLIEQLTKATYECMVCCETVRTHHAVWSCGNCYHIFHLRCIKKWARSPNAVVSGADKDGWRCPACQNLSFKFPNQYRCFCGKMRDPEVSRLETPHSCGDVCQKDRGEGCKHPCNILCHPGPCPECSAIVTKSCDCGKTKQTVKCGQSSVIKCESVCGRLLNCGQHFCKAQCHAGPCDKCEEVIVQECLGKHETREVICGSEMSFQESYSCLTVCSKPLDCGNHTCDKKCHGGACESCPRLPANVTRCPCGSQLLADLPGEPRTSCLDPRPTCGSTCNKPLLCGSEDQKHSCQQPCHEGPCGPCNGITTLTCRCLFMDKEFSCSEIDKVVDENGRFLCDRRCNRKKMCGRHKCGERCCIKEEHPCEMQCGRKLPCGLHKCEEPCHRNNCPPCLMAGFDELTCYCGAEVMFPPIPCGTRPPECHRPCTRQHTCDHPVRHNCHSEEACAPCTELTQKMCMGNHVNRANIPCHIKDISCGMKCSKKLPCGEHLCIRICHKGECLEEGQDCKQPCSRQRVLCDHPCGLPCHGEAPCPPSLCKAKVTVKCACGHREAETVCSIGVAMDNSDFQKITMQSLKDSLQGIMGASTINIDKYRQGQTQMLECNKECALIERNRRLAEALDIQNPDLLPKFGTYNYTEFLRDQARQNPSVVAGIEKDLSDLVLNANKSKQPSRSHAFPCMNSNSRRIIHELAESYGIETQSYDYEPKKNVVATARKDKCWIPSVTLTTIVQRESNPRAPPPIPHIHKEETLRQISNAAKQSTSVVGDAPTLAEGWQVIGRKTKKNSTNPGPKSAIDTIDKIEGNLEQIIATGTIDYASLTKESQEALKSEPVVDYFDFTVT